MNRNPRHDSACPRIVPWHVRNGSDGVRFLQGGALLAADTGRIPTSSDGGDGAIVGGVTAPGQRHVSAFHAQTRRRPPARVG